jgi:hypothetical protein
LAARKNGVYLSFSFNKTMVINIANTIVNKSVSPSVHWNIITTIIIILVTAAVPDTAAAFSLLLYDALLMQKLLPITSHSHPTSSTAFYMSFSPCPFSLAAHLFSLFHRFT